MIPTIQGTSENGGFMIAKNGFGIVAKTDPGWYGQGIYFTTKKDYVEKYAQETPNGRIYLINLVVTGNSYPVTEQPFDLPYNPSAPLPPNSFVGKAPKAGYQSHYIVVETDQYGDGYPVQRIQSKEPFDELVIFDGMQALPLFLIYCKDSASTIAPQVKILSTISVPQPIQKGNQEKSRAEWIANQATDPSESGFLSFSFLDEASNFANKFKQTNKQIGKNLIGDTEFEIDKFDIKESEIDSEKEVQKLRQENQELKGENQNKDEEIQELKGEIERLREEIAKLLQGK